MARVGLMLYTVRRACSEDFEATLRSVAAMGYAGVEVFDLHGHTAEDVRGWLDRDALTVCALHAPLDAVEADLEGLAATARALGTTRLVVSWVAPPTSAAEAAPIRDRLAAAAPAAAALGLALGFHNHDGELRSFDGEPPLLEQLLAEMPELFLELDLGWAWFAGFDPGRSSRGQEPAPRWCTSRTSARVTSPRTAPSATAPWDTTCRPGGRRRGRRLAARRAGRGRRARARRGRPLLRRPDDVRRRGRVIGAARIGIVGCGVISRQYAENARAFDSFDIVACADLDPPRSEALAASTASSRWHRRRSSPIRPSTCSST